MEDHDAAKQMSSTVTSLLSSANEAKPLLISYNCCHLTDNMTHHVTGLLKGKAFTIVSSNRKQSCLASLHLVFEEWGAPFFLVAVWRQGESMTRPFWCLHCYSRGWRIFADVLICAEVSQDMLSVKGGEWHPPWCIIGHVSTWLDGKCTDMSQGLLTEMEP